MEGSLSARGKAFISQRPAFFDVLSDLWSPKSNPHGIVTMGLAENVGKSHSGFCYVIANTYLDSYAHRDGEFHQCQCKFQTGIYSPMTPETSFFSFSFWTYSVWQLRINAHALTYGDGFGGSHKLKRAICHFLNRHFLLGLRYVLLI